MDIPSTAIELMESSLKVSLNCTEEIDTNLSKIYLILSDLNLKLYNIIPAINYYEKYANCLTKSSTNKEVIDNTEKVLEGLKKANDELKKKHNSVKSKEGTKKIFDDLVAKFMTKAGVNENQKNLNYGNMNMGNFNEMQLLDYMLKNGMIKIPPNSNNGKEGTESSNTNTNNSNKENVNTNN